jgi:hypothetical protein
MPGLCWVGTEEKQAGLQMHIGMTGCILLDKTEKAF